MCPSLPPQGLMNGVDEVAVKCIKAETPSGDHSAAATPQHSTQSVAVQHHLFDGRHAGWHPPRTADLRRLYGMCLPLFPARPPACRG